MEMNLFFFFTTIINLSYFVFCAEEKKYVVTLTKDTFKKFIETEEFTVVEFFAPWCGHCQKLAPEYEAAAKILDADGIKLASVDATVESELATSEDIAGFPTLKAFRKGKSEEYKGGRTTDSIVEWVRKMVGPTIVTYDSMEKATEASKKFPAVILGHFKSTEDKSYKIFAEVADASRQAGSFFAVVDTTGDDTLRVIRKDEETTEPIKIDTLKTAQDFVDLERFPLFGPIDASNYGDYFQNGRDIGWFIGTPDNFKAAVTLIREIAKHFRPIMNFVWLNADEFKDHAENVLGVDQFPTLVFQRKADRYIFTDHEFTSVDKVKTFIQDVFDGKIEKHLISQSIPETNDEAVKVVVGKTFMEMVFQKDKDVFLEVYAPWCGHCKQFEPIYQEFAESMKEHKNILILKMDGTKNESPTKEIQWSGFPSIFFLKAGEAKPLVYEGARTVQALKQYLSEHGSVEIPLEEKEETTKDEL